MAKHPVLFLVEDDTLLVNMYKTKFEREGFSVVEVNDGERALLQFDEQIPDFVIMDVMMPKLSGMDVLENMRKNDKLKNIPVIMLSNLSQPDKMKRAKELGVKDFLIKANFTPKEIVEKVKGYLQ